MLPYPHIEPVLFHLWGPLAVRWYGIAYAAAVLFGYTYIPFQARRYGYPFSKKQVQDTVTHTLLWAVVGGRLGYMGLYEPYHIIQDPWVLYRVWEGGMSFHGGLMGVGIGLLFYTKRHKMDWLTLADLMALGTPFGLFCGRMANFINGELWGRVTDKAWGMIFPQADALPRHPSQIYEAFLEGILLFALLNSIAHWTQARHYRGALTGLFLMGYGLTRFLAEFFREPTVDYDWLPWALTWGQILSVPLITGGILMILKSRWLSCVKH